MNIHHFCTAGLPIISIGDVQEAASHAKFPFQLISSGFLQHINLGFSPLYKSTQDRKGEKEQRSGMFAVIFAKLKAKN